MRYITPRKAAQGLGSAHQGTLHHWAMTVTAVALLILTPLFMIVVARAIGLPHQQLLVYFGRPIPALITGLFVAVGMVHFIKGTRIMIDDYLQGTARKAAIIFSVILGWTVIAAAIYALARMGLGAIVVL
ncbi:MULTISPECIES: succinate dehydrogenase, hydrophobic membrane anchor protein [unclassified Paracoccus (in: a-proteobacteria)]|uniref:succinate dehydrogenase, hydrophobic membrane anchor protein n=1 Tax=unclassified Paracoccus (in: a-proteobacteria) TaxID=2688777 RepID=UPI0012B37C73|nr:MULTISPECIES: succinate dehydrogenase, hydrophobic membrane anchor protein [unclassified Paracoccus (in: a-proteobacteria)]UXU75277.1 succinate dehydrogenase, hydrophobic membrane anchor protein [Paracoccus sp. SMMA_5]UXU81179.1 succinate dehydrogenase, hydrophobic membrane anchor protein [Paracoccus sp. SMMA_5_TC]